MCLIALFLMASTLFVSCKKHPAGTENNLTVPSPESGTDTGSKTYLPVKLSSGKSALTFSYNANHALYKIKYGNGDSTELKYSSSGKALWFRRYKNKVLVYTCTYNVDDRGVITGAEQFTVPKNNDYLKLGSYELHYNTEGKISVVSYYDVEGIFLYDQQYHYDSRSNLDAQNSSEPSLKAGYTYDTKNALFKNVSNAWLFALEKENPLFLSVVNNMTGSSYPAKTENNQISTYLYNTVGFPQTITSTVLGVKTVNTVTY